MKNFEIARQFDLMADLLEIRGENPFRIRAYRRAALNLQSLTESLEVLAREDHLEVATRLEAGASAPAGVRRSMKQRSSG